MRHMWWLAIWLGALVLFGPVRWEQERVAAAERAREREIVGTSLRESAQCAALLADVRRGDARAEIRWRSLCD